MAAFRRLNAIGARSDEAFPYASKRCVARHSISLLRATRWLPTRSFHGVRKSQPSGMNARPVAQVPDAAFRKLIASSLPRNADSALHRASWNSERRRSASRMPRLTAVAHRQVRRPMGLQREHAATFRGVTAGRRTESPAPAANRDETMQARDWSLSVSSRSQRGRWRLARRAVVFVVEADVVVLEVAGELGGALVLEHAARDGARRGRRPSGHAAWPDRDP